MIELTALLMGPLDRARGYPWKIPGFSMAWKCLYGYAMAIAFGHGWDLATVLITAGMVIGMSFGWGSPLGAAITGQKMDFMDLERWQTFRLVQESPWWALAYRGAIWGACVNLAWPVAVLMAGFVGSIWLLLGVDEAAFMFLPIIESRPDLRLLVLIPAYAVAMPAAVEFALWMGKRGDSAWKLQELLRGSIVGLIVLIVLIVVI